MLKNIKFHTQYNINKALNYKPSTMADYSLELQMEKYDPAATVADLQNLDEEIADETALAETLIGSNTEARLAAAKKFLAENSEMIREQHAKMQARVKALRDTVNANMGMESADAAYVAFAASEEAQEIARLLVELRAMSSQYHELLLATGREGRPPVF